MGKSLNEIAQQLKENTKKVQLIYAFNGTGKTRLSKEFKSLISLTTGADAEQEQSDMVNRKILYYNAFTEDLFYWDNDLEFDTERKLKIHTNEFTKWIFEEQGKDGDVVSKFQHYTDKKLTPVFNPDFSEIRFSFKRGNDEPTENIKISKGEESNFIWCTFYSVFEQVINTLNEDIESDVETEEVTNQFDQLEYVCIDDPVTSLDDNHLIQLAVDIAELIKGSKSEKLKFIITTHNPLFYNVLHNEFNSKNCYLFERNEDDTFELEEKWGDSNNSFSYHLHLKSIIEQGIKNNKIEKYHFTLLRNLYEKTASFLGFKKWAELLPGDKKTYYNRIIQFTSHSTLATEIVAEPSTEEKQIVRFLLEHLIDNYGFWKEEIDV